MRGQPRKKWGTDGVPILLEVGYGNPIRRGGPKMALTDTAIRGAKPDTKPLKMYDREGLFLLVNPVGSKLWRWRYRFNGKEKLMALGEYPSRMRGVYILQSAGLLDWSKDKLRPGRNG